MNGQLFSAWSSAVLAELVSLNHKSDKLENELKEIRQMPFGVQEKNYTNEQQAEKHHT
jgi:hypothetical protein